MLSISADWASQIGAKRAKDVHATRERFRLSFHFWRATVAGWGGQPKKFAHITLSSGLCVDSFLPQLSTTTTTTTTYKEKLIWQGLKERKR